MSYSHYVHYVYLANSFIPMLMVFVNANSMLESKAIRRLPFSYNEFAFEAHPYVSNKAD
jgi:hypothetical protein